MEWLLVLIILIIMPVGLWIMKKIDDFVTLPSTFPDSKENLSDKSGILVCGKSEFAKSLLQFLDKSEEHYVYIEDENSIDTEHSYVCLLAADSDDFKNLSISMIGRIRLNISNQVLLCNDRVYEKVFRESGEPFIYNTDKPEIMVSLARQRIEGRKC
jgi:hypothetical protein